MQLQLSDRSTEAMSVTMRFDPLSTFLDAIAIAAPITITYFAWKMLLRILSGIDKIMFRSWRITPAPVPILF